MAACSPHSLLQSRDPVVLPQGPAGAQTRLGRAGEHLCFGSHASPFIAFGGVKYPCQKMGVCMPHAQDSRGEGCLSLPPTPPDGPSLQHPISASSPPAKVKLHLGEWGEIGAGAGGGWNRTTSRLEGKPGSHRGVQLPCRIPKSRWCLAVVAGKLLESARKKEQGLEKFGCWFSNPQILICWRKRDVFYTERASEFPVGRRRRFLWGQGATQVRAVLAVLGSPWALCLRGRAVQAAI